MHTDIYRWQVYTLPIVERGNTCLPKDSTATVRPHACMRAYCMCFMNSICNHHTRNGAPLMALSWPFSGSMRVQLHSQGHAACTLLLPTEYWQAPAKGPNALFLKEAHVPRTIRCNRHI